MSLVLADIFETIADTIGDEAAIIQGGRTVTWQDFDDHSSRLAGAFIAAGLTRDSKVGMFLYNSIEYLETQHATFKMRGVPINVNYRYLDDELLYLLDNADCEAVVFHSSLGDRIARIKDRLPDLRLLIEVPDDDSRCPQALLYEYVLAANEPAPRIERGDGDLYMLYTGGTTGMPKGVMFDLEDFTSFLMSLVAGGLGMDAPRTRVEVASFIAELRDRAALPRSMPSCPLMHGTGMWLGAFLPQLAGGSIVLLETRTFNADELWQNVARHEVTSTVIVGDAFGRPMLRALDDKAATGAPYNAASLGRIVSSGAMFSHEVKAGLIGHIPHLVVMDTLGSTEAGMASSTMTADAPAETAKFEMGPGTVVLDEKDTPVEPGSGVIGIVAAAGGNVPLGYYKDEEKSLRTFREIDGVRYTFPGDMATVEADGSITLLGRGSNCINTGGEKVFPEEVEETVKTHEDVDDCLVFGVDDDRFGQRVVGVASMRGGATTSADELIAYTRTKLSSYKSPRELIIIDEVPRAPNGKADYKTARDLSGL